MHWRMSLGRAPDVESLLRSTRAACEARLPDNSLFRLLAHESHRLFPDDDFVDLFAHVGRACIAPRIVAVVMVLQRFHGMSDREAADSFAFDSRWKYAAGALDYDYPGFVHTVLVDMRARLRASKRPNRIFEAVLEVAKQAGLVGRKRVLDSTALYDAVATQDTVTLIRSSIRALLRVADAELEAQLRAVLKRDDDYHSAGKPVCDWDDEAAREALVDALARDAYAALAQLDGLELPTAVREAAALVATVVGQDLEQRDDGVFAIARRVAKDRIISTVDPEARHGHKTAARGFDGYKGHTVIEPDSEIIIATAVTPGNASDGSAAEQLLTEVLPPRSEMAPDSALDQVPVGAQPEVATVATTPVEQARDNEHAEVEQPDAPAMDLLHEGDNESHADRIEIYGDSSYGTAAIVERLEEAGMEANVKVAPASPPQKGFYSQDDFNIDTQAGTVCCPQGKLVQLRRSKDGYATADFGAHCASCSQRQRCTSSKNGRVVRVHPHHDTLKRARRRQRDPDWKARYRATRPKVERKIAHLMRRRHGGRRARVRGMLRVGHDFALLAAAVNLQRLAALRWRATSPPS